MELERFAQTRWGPKRRVNEGLAADDPRERLLDVIATSAFDNLRAYSNCCRSTLQALQTHLRLRDCGSLQASFALAGGIGGTGETCGAVLGALMAIGLSIGSDDPRNEDAQLRARAEASQFVRCMLAAYGSTRCYELQKALIGWCCDDQAKEPKWEAAGGPIACASICGEAARFAAQIILANDSGPA